jgi:beta-lactamase superfamily II metal-dependent hydrolase
MEVKIFDVSHGFCALVTVDNGNVMLIDAGHNEKTGFRPSVYLPLNGIHTIQRFVIQNFDQDHVSDLHNLRKTLPINVLNRNKSLPATYLANLKRKSGPITEAMQASLNMHTSYIHPVTNPPVYPSVDIYHYYNSYPAFQDTNNLSVVTFVFYDGLGFVFPGDMEKAGWQELLKQPAFCEHLRRVTIFVASHHGRESGYCEDVFEYCNPAVVIISDKEIMYDTQEQCYSEHARGVAWNGGAEKRYVLTTRSDGMITISKTAGSGFYNILTSK